MWKLPAVDGGARLVGVDVIAERADRHSSAGGEQRSKKIHVPAAEQQAAALLHPQRRAIRGFALASRG